MANLKMLDDIIVCCCISISLDLSKVTMSGRALAAAMASAVCQESVEMSHKALAAGLCKAGWPDLNRPTMCRACLILLTLQRELQKPSTL